MRLEQKEEEAVKAVEDINNITIEDPPSQPIL
jgi:hypothetical protein